MAVEVAAAVPAAKRLFEQASDILGYDLLAVCETGVGAGVRACGRAGVQVTMRVHGRGRRKVADGGMPLEFAFPPWHPAPDQPPVAVSMPPAHGLPAPLTVSPHPHPGPTPAPLMMCVCAGPKERLDSTAVSQPAIYVASLAAMEKLRAEGGEEAAAAADVCCGLSLGEYTALTYAGAMSFEDGVRLVKLRGESMQAAADAQPSGMVSVIGLSADQVRWGLRGWRAGGWRAAAGGGRRGCGGELLPGCGQWTVRRGARGGVRPH